MVYLIGTSTYIYISIVVRDYVRIYIAIATRASRSHTRVHVQAAARRAGGGQWSHDAGSYSVYGGWRDRVHGSTLWCRVTPPPANSASLTGLAHAPGPLDCPRWDYLATFWSDGVGRIRRPNAHLLTMMKFR